MNQIVRLLVALLLAVSTAVAANGECGMKEIETKRIALRDSILSVITGAEMPVKKADIKSFGAKGDGKTDCRKAFEKAMRKARKDGGMHLVVPEGTYYLKGPIHLVSDVCIDLEEGAVIRFDPDAEHYPVVSTSWEGTYLHNYSPMIYGYGLKNVSIIGKGTIDGNAMTTFATWRKDQKADQRASREMNHKEVAVAERMFGPGHLLRPHLIQFYRCEGITLEGVKITNSPFWCVHLLDSENIICRSLRYDAKLVNNDGIDPECSRNILIEDVWFDNGDDNVAIKSGRDNDGWRLGRPSENIIIRNCHFKGLHAVVIGSEMSAGVRNVIMENCDYAGYCKRGFYVKTNPDRGGFVSNIFISGCKFGEVEDLFYVTSKYAGEGEKSGNFSKVGDIFVDGLSCEKVSAAALVLQGTEKEPIRNVVFNAVEVGEAKNGVSFTNTCGVTVGECHIGGHGGVPTQVTASDRIFERK